MNSSLPEPTPRSNELEEAARHFSKHMKPENKQALMERLNKERDRFIKKRLDRSREKGRDR